MLILTRRCAESLIIGDGEITVTARFVAEYSIQLSYECICCRAL